jgi:hypothetical protein
MELSKKTILSCFLVLILSISAFAQEKDKWIIEIPKDLKITAVSGGRAPHTPQYKVEISSDGQGVYWFMPAENRKTGKFIKKNSFTLSDSGLRYIYRAIIKNDFFDLEKEYIDKSFFGGSYAQLSVRANNKTHTVRTENMAVDAFDDIMIAINIATPPNNDVIYNEILVGPNNVKK